MNAQSQVGPRARRPLAIRVGKRIRPFVNRTIARWSTVPNDPVLDQHLFAWTELLRREWTVIRDEMEAVLRHQGAVPPLADVSPDHRRIAGDGKWRSFFLYGYGYRIDENCERAPRTAAIVAGIPGLNSAFFSILGPGAHIPRHKGVTKAILTCHLGLRVPAPRERVWMDVEGETVLWADGQCIVFDDSQHHEVWNETGDTRVVLLIQFRRPATLPGRLLGRLFLAGVRRTAFVQEARRNLGAWDEAMKRAERGD